MPPSLLPRRGHQPHNFGRKPPSRPHHKTKPWPKPDPSKRLVKKYRKFQSTVKSTNSIHNPPHSLADYRKDPEPVTNVPNPIPDTGFTPTMSFYTHKAFVQPTTSLLYTTFSAHTPLYSSTVQQPLTSVPTYEPMTRFTSTTTTTATMASMISSSRISFPTSRPTSVSVPHNNLSIAIITLIAIGSACVFAGSLIVLRACCRPRQKPPLPIPSHPILADSSNPDFDTKESPLFGGVERFSGANSHVWSWTQYSQPKPLSEPPPALAASEKGALRDNVYGLGLNPPVAPLPSEPLPSTPSYRTSLMQAGHALSRAASRISTASMSIYPASPTTNKDKYFTGDGFHVLRRTSRAAMRKRSNTLEERRSPRIVASPASRRSSELPYAAASPQFLAESLDVPASQQPGRTRIKSAYFTPGAYPRVSATPIPPKKAEKDAKFNLPPVQKSEADRNRDAKALATAMGFGSPVQETAPPSPQPTLYPDDSMSVVAARRPSTSKRAPSRKQAPPKPSLLQVAPSTMDTSTALGNLMLMDFGTKATLADKLDDDSEEPGQLCRVSSKKTMTRSNSSRLREEKPPRVPSPPPLPSLAQMGLEHANPRAYADYKSPTYSIYGLYEEGRKSMHISS